MKISDLLLKYITDKNHGTIKNIYNNLDDREIIENAPSPIGHTYGDSYQEIFNNFNRSDNLNFLEIGIQRGGSLLAWRDYFPNANIYGVDIIDSILDEYKRDDIQYIFKDIKDKSLLEELFHNTMFDIIIDDGSHTLSDVLFVVNNYLQKLNMGGYLIIEDCQDPNHWLNEVTKAIKSKSFDIPENFQITTFDLRSGFSYDNYLITIKKT